MQRFTIRIRPADAKEPDMGWTGQAVDEQAVDEQAARNMAEADYRRAHPEVAAVTIERVRHGSD